MNLQRRSAFTLVELLVVIAIIGVLVALLLPAVQAAREAARRNTCVNNLKQIGLAVQMHHDSLKYYPTGRRASEVEGASWAFRLLPYMEQKAIYDSFDETVPVYEDRNAQAMRTPVDTYYCPSRRSPAADRDFDNNDKMPLVTGVAAGGDYAGNAGLHHRYGMSDAAYKDLDPALVAGPIHTFSKVKDRQVSDGLSQTLVVGEKHIPMEIDVEPEREHQRAGDTAFFAGDSPTTIFAGTEKGLAEGPADTSAEKFGGEHSQIVNFVFLDGHVKAINATIETETVQRLSTIGDGRVVDTGEL